MSMMDCYKCSYPYGFGCRCSVVNMEITKPQSEESINECVELSAALERQRAIKIIEAVMSLPIGGGDSPVPTAFQVGYQLALEEVIHRIKNEVWELNLPPDGVAIGAS